MILAIFLILLACFVILPVVGAALWAVFLFFLTGIFIGVLARLVVPGRQPIGILATVSSGWIGALAGGAIGYAAWGKDGHAFARELISIGIAAIAVVIFHAALRASSRLATAAAPRPRTHQGHKVIDV